MIEQHFFGRTGHFSTRTIFGAAAFGNVTQNEADRSMETLLEFGVNHIDTAASYGDAETRIGPWMKAHRKDFFLATKTAERTYQKARDEIHRSLEKLQTEQVDLLQLHALTDPQEWETAMNAGGALEAAMEAREQGLVRFIGVTGHGTTVAGMHLRSLEKFDFDSVLLPLNFTMMQNARYAGEFETLLGLCRARNVAVQTIKSITRGPWGETPQKYATWYEPLVEQQEIDLAVRWVLQRPDVFLNTAGDIQLLPKILKAASRFFDESSEVKTMDSESDAAMRELGLTPIFV